MGYSVECYALSHDALKAFVGSGRDVDKIINAEARLFPSSPGVPWRAALRDLAGGDRGRALAAAGQAQPGLVQPASDEEAAAMTALIRYGGRRVGQLTHNSRAGAKFRAMFDPAFTPGQFAEPGLAPLLLRRPLAFLVADDYPRWGGLTVSEVARLLGGQANVSRPPADPDQHEWLFSLFEILTDVLRREDDLVTLYL